MEFLQVGSGKIRQVFGWARGKDKRAGSLVYFSFDDIPCCKRVGLANPGVF